MTVQHSTGTLDIKQSDIVSEMSGTRGLFKRERWEKQERIPIATIEAVLVTEESSGAITLGFKSKRTTFVGPNELPRAFSHCKPAEQIEEFLTTLLGVNPSITVNNIDVKAEVARLQQAQEDAGNEVVGIDRRATLTRLALLGPVGALLFKKREVVRRKDL